MVRFPINLLNCRKVCRAIYKFDLIVIFAEFDDGLKYRVGAEVPKSDRQSFFVFLALHIQMRIAVRIRRQIFS